MGERERLPGWQAPPERVQRAKGTTWKAAVVVVAVLALLFWPVYAEWLRWLFS